MKVQHTIVAVDAQGNGYSTMEEIYGFRTTEGYVYLICAEGDCIVQFDGNIIDCWKNGANFHMPLFSSVISDFMERLREQGVLHEGEMITDLYTGEQIYADVIVKEDK